MNYGYFEISQLHKQITTTGSSVLCYLVHVELSLHMADRGGVIGEVDKFKG